MAECLGCNSHETLDIVRRPKITPVHELGRYMRRLCDRWTLVGRLLPSNKMLKEALRLCLWSAPDRAVDAIAGSTGTASSSASAER